MSSEEAKLPTIDPIVSALFDLEVRTVTARDGLNIVEEKINNIRKIIGTRKIQREDIEETESLLIMIREYFEAATVDLMDEIYQVLGEKNGSETGSNDTLNESEPTKTNA
jgi:hypothetical protein